VETERQRIGRELVNIQQQVKVCEDAVRQLTAGKDTAAQQIALITDISKKMADLVTSASQHPLSTHVDCAQELLRCAQTVVNVLVGVLVFDRH
jgi:hypothetical protein